MIESGECVEMHRYAKQCIRFLVRSINNAWIRYDWFNGEQRIYVVILF
ncbi:MAG: hypothetical protein NPIRA05_19290 [Nitrospirales bacterium]|nr:MAG: hypothetical protein NPIRA05_19290 [Nitrospirales bacterium]